MPTRSLLTSPARTILTRRIVSLSVTRKPPENFVSSPVRAIISLICGAAAVDEHDAHADQRQQHGVAHDRPLEIRIRHGVPTIFYHNRAPCVTLKIRKRLDQNVGAFCIVKFHCDPPLLSAVAAADADVIIRQVAAPRRRVAKPHIEIDQNVHLVLL